MTLAGSALRWRWNIQSNNDNGTLWAVAVESRIEWKVNMNLKIIHAFRPAAAGEAIVGFGGVEAEAMA